MTLDQINHALKGLKKVIKHHKKLDSDCQFNMTVYSQCALGKYMASKGKYLNGHNVENVTERLFGFRSDLTESGSKNLPYSLQIEIHRLFSDHYFDYTSAGNWLKKAKKVREKLIKQKCLLEEKDGV